MFVNRKEAGEMLAEKLRAYAGPDTIILALPRGGVPVAFEVARHLKAPLDVFIVRKIGHPKHPEYAIGALAEDGTQCLNSVEMAGQNPVAVAGVIENETAELKRRIELYRDNKPLPDLKGKTVIIIDDGLATGYTMRAAIIAINTHEPKRIIAAVPVRAPDVTAKFLGGDELISVLAPDNFLSVKNWYRDFHDPKEMEIKEMLKKAREFAPRNKLMDDSRGR